MPGTFMSREQGAGQNHNEVIADGSACGHAPYVRYVVTTLTD
jgi:hypothetical protein